MDLTQVLSAIAAIVSAGGAIASAIAAFKNLSAVTTLMQKSNDMIQAKNKEDQERNEKITKKVAGVLSLRIELIVQNLEKFAHDFKGDIFTINLNKGLPDEIIIESLDVQLVRDIYDEWEMLVPFQKKLQKGYSSDDQKIAAGFASRLLPLKNKLEQYM